MDMLLHNEYHLIRTVTRGQPNARVRLIKTAESTYCSLASQFTLVIRPMVTVVMAEIKCYQ